MKKRIPIIVGLLLVLLAAWIQITPTPFIHSFIERLDHLGYDLQLKTYILAQERHPDTPVAIIDIDDASLAAEGRWPWPRSTLATLIQKLSDYGAAVIAFDNFYPEKQPNIVEQLLAKLAEKKTLTTTLENLLKPTIPLFDEDVVFAKALSEHPTVLAITLLHRRLTLNEPPTTTIVVSPERLQELHIRNSLGYISNIPILQQAAKGTGFVNVYADSDGIIRRAPIVMKYKDQLFPSLALQSVMLFLGQDVELITPSYNDKKKLEGIKLGDHIIPTDEWGQVLIPFIGKSFTFPYFSATNVLHDRIPKDALIGKIVFVGTSATGLGDLQTTAIQSPFPGVEIQASLVNGILQEGFSYVPAWTLGAALFFTVLIGVIATFTFPYLGPRTSGIIIVAFPGLVLYINNYQWERTGLVLSLLIPVILVVIIALLNILYGYLFETRKRERLKEMFGQYVPERHIDEMIKATGNYALQGEDRSMSVLFADIRNFTTISEGMSAAELVDMLNTFFTPMTEIIFNHRGTIDKYVGDMIMAFWGAPLKDKNHARHAIESALKMQSKLKELQPTLAARNWPELNIGIGINSGIMSVGDMGSRYRRNYTVLGDSVNLASRVEGLSKFYGVNIIVTETTESNQPKFVFRLLDKVRVKGKILGVSIYEVICLATEATPALTQELETYHKALDAYFMQQWEVAYELMQKLHELQPETKIYKIYLERIDEFKGHNLPTDWDGVYIHVTK